MNALKSLVAVSCIIAAAVVMTMSFPGSDAGFNGTLYRLEVSPVVAVAQSEAASEANDESSATTVDQSFRNPVTSSSPNPYTSDADVEEGRLLVRGMCGACHGLDGTGGRAPNLTAKTLRHGSNPGDVYLHLNNGIEGTGMKGFALPDKMAWQIVSYLRQEKPEVDAANLPGDIDAGRALFVKHQCATCHGDDSRPGRRGQDLRQSQATVEHVRQSILDPSADVPQEWSEVALLRSDGSILKGLLMYENGYYVQLMDEQEQLHTVAKSDVDELRRSDTSIMPSFRKELSDQDVTDLIRYVISLRS